MVFSNSVRVMKQFFLDKNYKKTNSIECVTRLCELHTYIFIYIYTHNILYIYTYIHVFIHTCIIHVYYTHFILIFLCIQETSNGERKVLDLVDTTGSGDVDTSKVVTTSELTGREVEGVSGRTLAIPDHWVNPSGKWHVGIKAAFDLFPRTIKTRMQVLSMQLVYLFVVVVF